MKQERERPAAPPARKELRENPVKLCNEIARLWRTRMREREGGEGVMTQPGAHLVLSVLAVSDGVNQLELVRATHLRAPTVSVILKKMEAEGIVERRNDPDDLRAVRVYLTEMGRVLDRENIARILKIDAVALRGLDEEERTTLMRILPKLRDNLLADFSEDGEEEHS